MICDLHIHSIYSDGTCSPEEIIDLAIKHKISAIALTDHNAIDGLPHLISASAGKNIDIATGTEFSVDYNGKELHLLALFIKPEFFNKISDLMKGWIDEKEQSNINLVKALVQAGFDISYDEIKAATPNGKINRAHVATAMLKKGYVTSVEEAFKTYLSKDGVYYKEPHRTDVFEMLDFINSIGAVSVLAHPFLNLSKDELQIFLPLAKQRGLIGMECYYSLYDTETTSASLYLADKFQLLKSGGSDFHGLRKPDIDLGVGKGNLKVPYEWYLELKKMAK
jgi:predicted metal-dependent phosphoesterase TrpH